MNTLAIETHRAQVQDAEAIATIHETSWKQAYTGLIPYKALATMIARRDAGWWDRAIRKSTRILVMKSMGEIVGYATFGSNRVSALPQRGEVYELYMKPEYQGVGLGKRLFLDARTELTRLGLSGCVVWVLEDNDPAVGFYRNAGGRAIAEGNETFNGQTLSKLAFAWS